MNLWFVIMHHPAKSLMETRHDKTISGRSWTRLLRCIDSLFLDVGRDPIFPVLESHFPGTNYPGIEVRNEEHEEFWRRWFLDISRLQSKARFNLWLVTMHGHEKTLWTKPLKDNLRKILDNTLKMDCRIFLDSRGGEDSCFTQSLTLNFLEKLSWT